jgi:hypothetical protein
MRTRPRYGFVGKSLRIFGRKVLVSFLDVPNGAAENLTAYGVVHELGKVALLAPGTRKILAYRAVRFIGYD